MKYGIQEIVFSSPFLLVASIVFGLICNTISKKRGMENGFWWGFLLGIIGLIVVAVRPNEKLLSAILENQEKEQKLLSNINQSLMEIRKNNLLVEAPVSILSSPAGSEASPNMVTFISKENPDSDKALKADIRKEVTIQIPSALPASFRRTIKSLHNCIERVYTLLFGSSNV